MLTYARLGAVPFEPQPPGAMAPWCGRSLGETDIPVLAQIEKLGTTVKWVSYGVLALAGAFVLVKVSDLLFD